MLVLGEPAWGAALVFAGVAMAFVVGLRLRTRGRNVWRYDTGAAWLRAGVYFAGAWALAAATGTLWDPDKAVRNYLYVATSPEVDGVTGWYFKDQRPIAPSLPAQDPELRRELWTVSCAAVGLVVSASHP